MDTLLVIDNYDSFTYNLVQMFKHFDLLIKVFRSDKITLNQAKAIDPDYLLISPGPKDPKHTGMSIPLILSFYKRIPVLGVCLGMQCINEAFGGSTVSAPVPMHGKTSMVEHTGKGIFSGVPQNISVARYHSLAVKTLNGELEITAKSDDNVIMGLSHKKELLYGVQFHPESFLTEYGFLIIENFLKYGSLKDVL